MAPWVARKGEPPRAVDSAAVRRASPRCGPAQGFSATHRIDGDRTSFPPVFCLPASVRAWPIGAAAPAFLWALAPRLSRPASPPVWAPAAEAGAAAPVWLRAAPADPARVKRPP